jgi:hypothetical protein
MYWHTLAKKMNAPGLCKSKWLDEGHDEKSSNHVVVDQARKSKASRVAASYRCHSLARAGASDARASATTASIAGPAATTTTSITTRHHRQQVSASRQPPASPLATQYRVAPPTKYFGDSYPRKFIMCYEAAIASSGINDTTLTKSFIISLRGAVANWYARLQPSQSYPRVI